MDAAQVASVLGAVSFLALGVLAYFKFKPGQKETLKVSVAEATLNIAKGTITMITSEMEEQFQRMAGEQAEVRQELRHLRDEQRIMQTLLDAVTRERDILHRENETLREKVASLEERIKIQEGRNVAQDKRTGAQDVRGVAQDARDKRQSDRGKGQDIYGHELNERERRMDQQEAPNEQP